MTTFNISLMNRANMPLAFCDTVEIFRGANSFSRFGVNTFEKAVGTCRAIGKEKGTIPAIKAIRIWTGLGLLEAKTLVDGAFAFIEDEKNKE